MHTSKRTGAVVCAIALGWVTSAVAVQPLEMTNAIVLESSTPNQVVVTGHNFNNGGTVQLTLGGTPLVVQSQTDTVLVAELPTDILPGSYVLVAWSGNGAVREDSMDITIGAEGPEGPPGAQGEQGPPGPQGEQGIQGDQGVQGLPGADGADGAPGAPGQSVVSVALAVGDPNCPFGGTAFTGISGVNYACNGAPGDDGAPGVQGVQGPHGEPGPAGPPGPSGGLLNEVCKLYQLTAFPAPASLVAESPEATCDDSLDNDCDGFVDVSDSDCEMLEMCEDGIDNDNDSQVDCADPDCFLEPSCGCLPDAFEPNEIGLDAYFVGSLTDTAGGGGGNEGGLIGSFCNGAGVQYLEYAQLDAGPFDGQNDSNTYYVQVVADPGRPASCESYTLSFSNGPVGAQQTISVTGNLVPDSDSDWYRFDAVDIEEGHAVLDSFRAAIEFTVNPDNRFRLKVFRGDLNSFPICSGF